MKHRQFTLPMNYYTAFLKMKHGKNWYARFGRRIGWAIEECRHHWSKPNNSKKRTLRDFRKTGDELRKEKV